MRDDWKFIHLLLNSDIFILQQVKAVIRVALKYCGGCDCMYDRLDYVNHIRQVAGSRIEWVTLEDGNFNAIMLICGCCVACLEEELEQGYSCKLVSIRDDRTDSRQIIEALIERGI